MKIRCPLDLNVKKSSINFHFQHLTEFWVTAISLESDTILFFIWSIHHFNYRSVMKTLRTACRLKQWREAAVGYGPQWWCSLTCSLCLHTSTGTCEWWMMKSLILPRNVRRILPIPRVPVTIREAFSSLATLTITSPGLPPTLFTLPPT